MPDLEDLAWVTVPLASGAVLRTNSYADYAAGARFVAVLDAGGTQLGWWPSQSWADPVQSAEVMAAIWSAAACGQTCWDDEYGVELDVRLARGWVRACPQGTYVRLLDEGGDEVDGGSAYWSVEEWVTDPELVMGAVLGAAGALARGGS